MLVKSLLVGNKCFRVFGYNTADRKNWSQAVDTCRALAPNFNSDLASINSPAENGNV